MAALPDSKAVLRHREARVSAYDCFGSLAFRPLGLIVWGPIAAAAGIDVALWMAFAIQLTAFLVIFAIPDVRRLPAYQ